MPSPFGDPDGSRGPLESQTDRFISLPSRFGPVGRPVSEYSRAHVIAGTQGVGKTLFLRRLQDHFAADNSVNSTRPNLKSRNLGTEQVIDFSQLFRKTANTEAWSVLWANAIRLSAATHVLTDSSALIGADGVATASLRRLLLRWLPKATTPRSPVETASLLCSLIGSRHEFELMQQDDTWIELERLLQKALRESRELYLFVDAIDDNYRWAPAYWQQCQRGLFYAVMDTERTDVEASKLHTVIAIRDLVLSSVARSEHAARYLRSPSIVQLDWTWASCAAFLNAKLYQLEWQYFPASAEEKTFASLFGRSSIRNDARGMDEPLQQYFLRHTRLNPRDIIIMGNDLLDFAEHKGVLPAELSDSDLRERIAKISRHLARGSLAQVGNQVMTNVMPWNASQQRYLESYINSDEHTSDAIIRELQSILRSAGCERFDAEGLERLESEARSRFGAGCRFADVLWQNRLLGCIDAKGQATFYDGTMLDEITIEEAEEYLLNPIVLDLVPSLRVVEGEVMFPSGAQA